MLSIQKLTAEKTACIKRITERVAPHLWESGFVAGPIGQAHPYKLWVKHNKDESRKVWRLHGLAVDHIEGVTEDGIIPADEQRMAGLVTTPFVALSLEDLLRVERWAIKQFPRS